jgi:tRNA G18 (ribose-2'-O)-methylase SpoU
MIVCGSQRIDPKIARDGVQQVSIERHRTLEPVLVQWRRQGTRIVGLEQTTGSTNLYEYVFPVELLLVVGNERDGLGEDILPLVDDVVEIPVYGLPFSHNVATATAIALYEYCRQHGR